jgi:peptidoglycan/xylan/chitin deacetylase (PgdA/CDA1 family)
MDAKRSTGRNRGRLRVALYHHISEAPSPFYDEIGVSLAPAEFERHLRYFQHNYDVVSMNEVLTGSLPKRPLLITFDDAYKSVFEVAAPLLSRLGLPALFLISSGHVDGKMLMNDHVLCYLSRAVGLAKLESGITGRPAVCSSIGELIGNVVANLDYSAQSQLAAELTEKYALGAKVLDELRDLYITREQVGRLHAHGIEVGNHTYSHVFCRHLGPADEELEILQAQLSLQHWTGKQVRAFSIPYGYPIDLTEHSREVLLASGHEAIFTASSQRNPPGHHGPVWDRIAMGRRRGWGVFACTELFPWIRSLRSIVWGKSAL